MPAIVSGMLLSFIVMLGIYGVPALLGAPANINVLTTYIFNGTKWSPPLYYNTATAVAIIPMLVTEPAGPIATPGRRPTVSLRELSPPTQSRPVILR